MIATQIHDLWLGTENHTRINKEMRIVFSVDFILSCFATSQTHLALPSKQVRYFARIMEILDLAMLDLTFLSFKPSELAASAILIVHPQIVQLIPRVSGYSMQHLEPCVARLKAFTRVDYVGPRRPTRSLVALRIHPEDMYTRQAHNHQALSFLLPRVRANALNLDKIHAEILAARWQ